MVWRNMPPHHIFERVYYVDSTMLSLNDIVNNGLTQLAPAPHLLWGGYD